jgi:hypothetical protein
MPPSLPSAPAGMVVLTTMRVVLVRFFSAIYLQK